MSNLQSHEPNDAWSHLVLDSREWFIKQVFESGKALVIENAGDKDPNEFFLSPLMSLRKNGNKHMAIVPFIVEGRPLGACLCFYSTPEVPAFDVNFVAEATKLLSLNFRDLWSWIERTTVDRLSFFFRSRLLKYLAKEWYASLCNQESCNFYNANRMVCDLFTTIIPRAGADMVREAFARAPWLRQLADCTFYQLKVLLPTRPTKDLFGQNDEACRALEKVGLKAPDFRQMDSPIFTAWLHMLDSWVAQCDQEEEKLKVLKSSHSSSNISGEISNAALSHRDLYDIIGGSHQYSRGLQNNLSSYTNLAVDFPWWEKEFMERLNNEVSSTGSFRVTAAIGVVSPYNYRTFFHPHELMKGWDVLAGRVRSLIEEGKAATGCFLLYKSLVEYLHPFEDGNGRICRITTTILLRRAGWHRVTMNSDLKVLSLSDYFNVFKKSLPCQQ